jgi:hypothetical protein
MRKGKFLSLLLVFALITGFFAFTGNDVAQAATVYEVGPGYTYANIGDVPWESLNAGDTVNIHWRSTPYKEKWVICRQGTASAPITVSGVAGPNGELPVIDGNGATTRAALDYSSEARGILKIGIATIPADTMPKYIVVENLEFRNAHTPYTFTDDGGAVQSYVAASSGIYVEKGENITVRNCTFRDCGNGFFVASNDVKRYGVWVSRDILVEGCYFDNCGNSGSMYEHGSYCAAINQTYQYNHYGPLVSGSTGYSLKDRGAGTVVRYNWIEAGRRQISLDDGEDSKTIVADPSYNVAHVYGNVLIEPDSVFDVWGCDEIISFGGDNRGTPDRLGPLYFYNNTVVTYRTQKANPISPGRLERTCLFYVPSNDTSVDARNNIFFAAGNAPITMMNDYGIISISHNWFSSGWSTSMESVNNGTLIDDGTTISGTDPGFANLANQDLHLAAGSPCINAGTALNPAVLPAHNVVREYVKHQSSTARAVNGTLDIGAYEY